MKREEIIEVLKKYSYTEKIRGIGNDFYMEVIASRNIESIADELQAKEVTDEMIKKQGMIEEGIGDKYFVGIHYNNDWISGAKAHRDNLI